MLKSVYACAGVSVRFVLARVAVQCEAEWWRAFVFLCWRVCAPRVRLWCSLCAAEWRGRNRVLDGVWAVSLCFPTPPLTLRPPVPSRPPIPSCPPIPSRPPIPSHPPIPFNLLFPPILFFPFRPITRDELPKVGRILYSEAGHFSLNGLGQLGGSETHASDVVRALGQRGGGGFHQVDGAAEQVGHVHLGGGGGVEEEMWSRNGHVHLVGGRGGSG